MADHSITISNQITMLGPAETSKWGVMVWGVNDWGTSRDLQTLVEKLISNSITPSQSIAGFDVVKAAIRDEISGTFEMTSENLKDGEGYSYVFVKPSTEAENRALTQWTEV